MPTSIPPSFLSPPPLPYPALSLVAQGLTKEFNLERGSRQSSQLDDILDESDPDAQEAFEQEVGSSAPWNSFTLILHGGRLHRCTVTLQTVLMRLLRSIDLTVLFYTVPHICSCPALDPPRGQLPSWRQSRPGAEECSGIRRSRLPLPPGTRQHRLR